MAVPVLLGLLRSVKFDFAKYRRLRAALEPGELPTVNDLPHNTIAVYQRKCLDTFAFIDEAGQRYGLILLGVVVLGYTEETRLSCSVLTGATNTGKWLLLLLSVSSFVAIVYGYLKLHYIVRRVAQAAISGFSNLLAADEAREAELNEATALSETVRKRDGLRELVELAGKASFVGVVGTVIWQHVMHENACGLAYAIFPDSLVDKVASIFKLSCPPSG
jgi:hypothetical protein